MKVGSLRSKFSVIVVGSIVASVGLLGGLVIPSIRRPIQRANQRTAEALVRNLAANSRESMLMNDELLLTQFLDQLKNEEPSLGEAAILDADGRIIAHTDQTVRPGAVYRPPSHGQTVMESIEVKGRLVGRATATFSDREAEMVVMRTTRLIGMLTVGLIVLGVGATLVLVRYITKPLKSLSQGVVLVGSGDLDHKIPVTTHDELGDLATAFNYMTIQLKKAHEDHVERERLKHELKIAREIQMSLLPRECPKVEGFEIGAFYRSAKEVGGDYYDFFWVDHRRLGVVIADVAGKGVPGALGMTLARNSFRTQAVGQAWPSAVLARTHVVLKQSFRQGMFVTMFYALLDVRERVLTCSNAGHPPMLIFRASGEHEVVDPPGMALGFGDYQLFQSNVTDITVQLQSGDLVVLYSDGIPEALGPNREDFGERRLVQLFDRMKGAPLNDMLRQLEQDIVTFTDREPQHDDMTVVAIRAG